MAESVPRLVVGGATSGVGKTTVSTGLMAALRRRGLRVQPFKVGPDYIDPGYHRAATGVPSRNLDGWMVPGSALLELFSRASRGADVAIIEGVMGVFDGHGGLDGSGSTADVARRLGAPTVVVLDAGKMAQSAGAMALGYARFAPDLRVAGFLLNNVAGESHHRWCREAIEASGAGRVLGYLPRDPRLKLPERHLGLVPTRERRLPEGFLDGLAELVEAHVDVDGLLSIARSAGPLVDLPSKAATSPSLPRTGMERASPPRPPGEGRSEGSCTVRSPSLFPAAPVPTRASIAVAEDEAFNFYYQDNLDLLLAHGAELLPFSPLHDPEVPEGADAIYLGGGFPELFAAGLSGNSSMVESVRSAAGSGMPVYAECGGLMYLCAGIEDGEGERHPMVGLVPGWCSMRDALLRLGYVEVCSVRDTLLGPSGTLARGHEFHWSRWDGPNPATGAYRVLNQSGRPEGYARDNLLASFVHLHFGANPDLAPAFVECAHAHRLRRAASDG